MATRRMNEMWRRMALDLVLCVLLFHSCLGQDTSTASSVIITITNTMITNPTTAPATNAANTPADTTISDAPKDTEASQTVAPVTVKDTVSSRATDQATIAAPSGHSLNSVTDKGETELLTFLAGFEKTAIVVMTSKPETTVVECVEKEAVQDRNAVIVELQTPSSCDDTKNKIKAQIHQLCPTTNCTFEIFQEENSKDVIVTGSMSEDDVTEMVGSIANIEDLGVANASVREQNEQPPKKESPAVLVSLLVAGLALAAGLIGGYVWKNRRSKAKGMKLAEESMMPDEENQGNTLVSVAPLNPPEPQEKPSLNGESPEAVKTQNPPAATNGHSATKTADTEL
ncbi:uncharacterized protein si:dkey-261h17.1 [Pygocentrus nattereri]|uniref:uncharacterized protein si:dkey-261h17.1 n=1 Tax=Pygocentrus nattereri TaxID=42514 RepID=UPI000814615B|nr:uncharacterized protein si:dkey-261h17.1 [Pygocentrus nattereri]